MNNQRLISFDIQADFGFFKKPDYNDGVLLTYNMLHKPALLGILGAIIGLRGYRKKGEWPEYYQRLAALPVGIQPLEGRHEKGNFQKTIVKYTNTVGYANQDGNLLVEESMLIRPAYRCYLLLSEEHPDHRKLYEYIREGWAEYIPYLGKNEYPAWFGDSFREYAFKTFVPETDFRVSSLFIKEGVLKGQQVKASFSFSLKGIVNRGSFVYFERLPVGFHPVLMQYELADFAFTDWTLQAATQMVNLYQLEEEGKIVQLF